MRPWLLTASHFYFEQCIQVCIGCVPQTLLDLFLDTLSHFLLLGIAIYSQVLILT